ncbi:hypothetical protein [Amycolatopsis sp. w19]|uniref:hypothetical protein n=1 Tax=Amycolatopsis sp. w19 TaxID=3448134 RepID=UPI003F1CBB11
MVGERKTLPGQRKYELGDRFGINLGWSLARVSDHLGVNHTTVLNKLRERGIPTRDPLCSGVDANGFGRVTVVQAVTVVMGVVVGC